MDPNFECFFQSTCQTASSPRVDQIVYVSEEDTIREWGDARAAFFTSQRLRFVHDLNVSQHCYNHSPGAIGSRDSPTKINFDASDVIEMSGFNALIDLQIVHF